jgi:Phage derived protein Gp49-like (DUF891)
MAAYWPPQKARSYSPITIASNPRSGSAIAASSAAACGRRAHDSVRLCPISKYSATIRPFPAKNLKELRPGSSGTSEVRILFVFDPWRSAILLVAGDKSGKWNRWYAEAIPRAEQL